MSDNETSISAEMYKALLTGFSEEELQHEKIEETNRMLAAYVELFNARREKPVDNQKVANRTEAAQWAMEKANAVYGEIRRRVEGEDAAAEATQPTREQMAQSLREARISGLDEWLERAGELTDMARTLMSMSLHLAAQLPTEAPYDADTWNYPRIQERAQEAERYLVKARKQAMHAAHYIESAIRGVGQIKNILQAEVDPDEPGNYDEMPF